MMALLENTFPWFGYMIDLGGSILLVIIIFAAVLWTLMLERLLFVWLVHTDYVISAQEVWQKRPERRTWYAQQFRNYLLGKSQQTLQQNMGLVHTLIKLCPLLGLLGTVLGMLEIFDAVAISGGTNPRATAGGVSKAIITTMAGLLVAISALPITGYITRKAQESQDNLANRLPLDG
jgi:biopolymer transport protein ExbB